MKRKRTLSGIRAALDYKSLNVFGDIVGDFHGQKIPSVEDFNSYLQSQDACHNLNILSSQKQSQSGSSNSKASENSSTEKSKRGRKPKKRAGEDDSGQSHPPEDRAIQGAPSSSVPSLSIGHNSSSVSAIQSNPTPTIVPQPPPPAVIGSIGQFFQRFCEKFPRGTTEYDVFVKLVRAYEGKSMDDSTFYSCMKDILKDDQSSLLDDFVALIRPEEASEMPSWAEPIAKEDFPFNADRKKNKTMVDHSQQHLHQQQQLQMHDSVPTQSQRPATLNKTEVSALVKSAVSDKAKDFLLQAKSSMDPHTYVSFLDIMVELRSLYKANAIEDAIEKLDIAKGILTRVNPLLRVELDRYFPIVNANGAKHNLEHHTFEQSQRQYREWQQAQVARKQMLMEESNSASPSTSEDEKNKAGGRASGYQNWWADIATASKKSMDPAQKKERVKLTAYEKEQIQNARRIAKENALLKQSAGSGASSGAGAGGRAEKEGKEDLLDVLSTKIPKKRTPTASPPNLKTAQPAKHSDAPSRSQRTPSKSVKRPASSGPQESSYPSHPPSKGQTYVATNNLADFQAPQHMDPKNHTSDFSQYVQPQQSTHLQPVASISPLLPPPGSAGAGGIGGVGNGGVPGGSFNQSAFPFPAAGSVSLLPTHPYMPTHSAPSAESSSSRVPRTDTNGQQMQIPLGMGVEMPHQMSSYGHPVQMSGSTLGGVPQQRQQQWQQISHSSTAIRPPAPYGSIAAPYGSTAAPYGSSAAPYGSTEGTALISRPPQSGSVVLPPPPSGNTGSTAREGRGVPLPPYSSAANAPLLLPRHPHDQEDDYNFDQGGRSMSFSGPPAPLLSTLAPHAQSTPPPPSSTSPVPLLPPYGPAAVAAASSMKSGGLLLPGSLSEKSETSTMSHSLSQLQPQALPLRPPSQSASDFHRLPPSRESTDTGRSHDCNSGGGDDGNHRIESPTNVSGGNTRSPSSSSYSFEDALPSQ